MSVSALAIAALVSAAPVTAVEAPRDLAVLNAVSAARIAQDTAPDGQAGDAPAADPGDGPPRIPYQDVSAAQSDQEILVTGEMEPTPGDPLERANLKFREPEIFAELKSAFDTWNAGMLHDPNASSYRFTPQELADHFGWDS